MIIIRMHIFIGLNENFSEQLTALKSLISSAPTNEGSLEHVLRTLASLPSTVSADSADSAPAAARSSGTNLAPLPVEFSITDCRVYAHAFFPVAAMFNHSCAPNTVLTYDSNQIEHFTRSKIFNYSHSQSLYLDRIAI